MPLAFPEENMSTNYGQQVYSQGSGTASTTLFDAVRLPRNPTAADVGYQLGKNWVNTSTNAVWYLANNSSNAGVLQASWVNLAAGSILAGVDTINTIAPDGAGNFTFSSSNGSVGIAPIVNGLDLTVARSPTKYDGNTGGDVVPNGTNQLFIVGNNTTGINVVGNSPINTLTISNFQATTTQEGAITLATNSQAIAGTDAANAVTSAALAAKLGTQTDHSLALFKGSTAALAPLGVATNGQIPIGSTGLDPVLANITSTGGTITVTNGPGTINLDLSGGTTAIDSIHPDSGTDPVVPTAAGLVNIIGSGSTTTEGSLNTLTVQLTGLTNHAVLVGAGTTTITKVGPTATAGQVLQSAGAAADPAFSTATYPSTTTVSQILYSSATNVVSGLSTANRGVLTTGATGIPVITALATDGQLIIGSTAGAPAASTLSAGTGISISNGSNSISIAVNGSVVGQTLTGNSGGAISPSAGNWNTVGTGSITIAGSGSTLTTQLTGLTNHNVLVGAGTATITNVAPSATSGVPLISQGVAADPTFGTAVVAGGGTGNTTFTAYSIICAGTTATGAFQNVSGVGTAGQFLTSNGAGALPTWQTAGSATISITGDSGGALTANSFTFTGGTTGLTFSGAGTTETLTGTLVVANGGTGRATLTNHGVLVGAGTSAITQLAAATNNQILVGNTSADPSFKAFSINIQTFTSTGTYTPTAGMIYCIIEAVGGGGGGGGAASATSTLAECAGGGGGGGYARKTASAAIIGASQAVTVGAAGSAGSAGTNPGGNGGDSSLGAICIAKGGSGGAGSAASAPGAGGAGGIAGTGDITFAGMPGGTSQSVLYANNLISTTCGGNSYFGSGGVAIWSNSANTTGSAGQLYGGGGGGGLSVNAGGTQAGAAGAKGVVIVTEYIIS